ncbi:YgaP family membrane protein [Pseudothauera rhizosphaerae]|uniref:DUF2892 domain-containing protein n=1 Tax=Pseudothauera rhizosphaerae TaxID=2565932 RepID=A0A4S4ATT9_9RHOO|nr:DUF2892 domain-containing protein [Pseudothauera rhizosphaerae]THF63347.1 DUF2892 domain-containing protein [Pseudothauera rhizosphaerae]
MTSWQIVRIAAGFFILLSLALGVPGSPVFVSQWWLAFTVFVGLNLLQSGFTRWCLLETLLRRLGVRPGC